MRHPIPGPLDVDRTQRCDLTKREQLGGCAPERRGTQQPFLLRFGEATIKRAVASEQARGDPGAESQTQ